MQKLDFSVENHGTIYLLRPRSQAAEAWVDDNLPRDVMYFGDAVAIEHRYIGDIADGIINDGLSIA